MRFGNDLILSLGPLSVAIIDDSWGKESSHELIFEPFPLSYGLERIIREIRGVCGCQYSRQGDVKSSKKTCCCSRVIPVKTGFYNEPRNAKRNKFPFKAGKKWGVLQSFPCVCAPFYICISGNPKVEPHHLNQLIIAVFSRSAIYSYICRYYNQAWG